MARARHKMTVYRNGRDVPVETYERNGAVLRVGTYDEYVQREIVPSYGWLQMEGRRILDVGANIGLFSALALERGAALVVSVEPERNNFRMMELNARGATLIEAAVVSDNRKHVSLYMSETGKNPGNTSTEHFRGRGERMVAAVNLHELIEKHHIDTIKMDCEGAEYDLLSAELPHCVRQIAMEIHLNKREWREQRAPELVGRFHRQWDCRVTPKIGAKNWTTLGGWTR